MATNFSKIFLILFANYYEVKNERQSFRMMKILTMIEIVDPFDSLTLNIVFLIHSSLYYSAARSIFKYLLYIICSNSITNSMSII